MLDIKNLHAGIDGKEILKGLTLRVGIHHRLFILRDNGRVAVRELVSRESFERTLKRYRR